MNGKQVWRLLNTAFSSWVDDYAQSMGAALAYYTMFSIAPLLLIVISIAGLIFGVALLLIGATTVFGELQDALDRIWRGRFVGGDAGVGVLLRADIPDGRRIHMGIHACMRFTQRAVCAVRAG